MSRFLIVLVAFAMLLASASANDAVPSGARAALLLRNSAYGAFTLRGASKSLDELEAALKSQGFRIERRENLNAKDLKTAAEDFVQSVPTNGVALVYYVGLGAHVERQKKWYNLLRPVGEKIESDNDYRSRGLNVNEFVEMLEEESGSRTNLIILDACWESPLKVNKGTVHAGLREFETGPDTTVVFAAASGQVSPPPKSDSATPLARALAANVGKLDGSIKGACDAISKALGKPWISGAAESGIGPRSTLPVIEKLAEGKTPGTGFINSVGMPFRWCPPGSFTMGSEDSDDAAARDRKPVQVTLSKGFWIGQHEVTQREYSTVMRKNVPIGFTVHKNAPFWGITEPKHILEFCKKLTDLDRKAGVLPAGWEYACPTEAEWEYACRAGSSTAYSFGDSPAELGKHGNFADKTLRTVNPNYYWAHEVADDGVAEALAPVGTYRPNAWGIRDMHGNVAELVADHLLPELSGGMDPLVRVEKAGKPLIRGGAWCSLPLYCQSSFRNTLSGRKKFNFVGFRVTLKKVK